MGLLSSGVAAGSSECVAAQAQRAHTPSRPNYVGVTLHRAARSRPPSGRHEVAVVRHPIADARNVVVGYELRFGGSIDLGDPAMDAKATSALLVDAFGDIGLETLAGRHPAWVTIARNFLVEIGPPPVRPDRAVLQITAYPARDDLLADAAAARAQRLHDRARRATTAADDLERADVALLDRRVDVGQRRRSSDLPRDPARARSCRARCSSPPTCRRPRRRSSAAATLGFTYFQGEYFAQPRLFRHRGVATAGLGSLRRLAELTARRRLLRGPRADHRLRRRPVAEAAALRQLGLLRPAADASARSARRSPCSACAPSAAGRS